MLFHMKRIELYKFTVMNSFKTNLLYSQTITFLESHK